MGAKRKKRTQTRRGRGQRFIVVGCPPGEGLSELGDIPTLLEELEALYRRVEKARKPKPLS